MITTNEITSPFEAIKVIESDEHATYEEEVKAWSFLVKGGYVWQLQGRYERVAVSLIEDGILDKEGNIL